MILERHFKQVEINQGYMFIATIISYKRTRIRNIVDKYLFLLLDFPIRRFRQDAKATVIGLSVDWYGLDIEGCKYLEGGCKGNAGDVVSFSYPIKVLPYYPPVCT